jgi:hypothetical protein
MNKLFKVDGFKNPQELYAELDKAIELYTSETIWGSDFLQFINDINKNEFGIKIDPDLIQDNREDFNESGLVSYTDYSYESSYEDEE